VQTDRQTDTGRQTDRQTDGQAGRQRDRQTDIETGRQADGQTDIQTDRQALYSSHSFDGRRTDEYVICGVRLTSRNRSTRVKIRTSATLFTINATRTGLWSNTGLRGERPAIDSLGYGIAALNQELCLKIGWARGTHEKRWTKSRDILGKGTTLKINMQMGTNY
jgi:hypothetical protein